MWDVHRARASWPRLEPLAQAQVWLIRLPDDQQALSPETLACLSPQESQRAQRFAQARDARRYMAAHAALRTLLGELLGCAPDVLPWQTDAHGKPHLPGHRLQFNLSHSDAWALVAVHPARALGVDLEIHHPWHDMADLAGSIFHPQESTAWARLPVADQARALHAAWTRKEACLKAVGVGLDIPPEQVCVGLADAPAQGRWQLGHGHQIDAAQGVHWCDLSLPLPEPHSACLAWTPP
ncbi:MAG: 4'-phosphopantetheinyl transferase superfamily protein [Proteobacteria bacterium]|uniref:4'-phosphopantetheinyl transferase family protein n=1 Tax=Aquabacterium sp. TaxID=1872578 RepID=UPI0035C6B5E9|nr:4'-phosphopantetheinyl transferase superfamily protein [Pseudomonadota bacterium]